MSSYDNEYMRANLSFKKHNFPTLHRVGIESYSKTKKVFCKNFDFLKPISFFFQIGQKLLKLQDYICNSPLRGCGEGRSFENNVFYKTKHSPEISNV